MVRSEPAVRGGSTSGPSGSDGVPVAGEAVTPAPSAPAWEPQEGRVG